MDYLTLRRREFETTLRVLQAYPDDQPQMRPAAKSRTAAELAMTLVNEERVMTSLVETGAVNRVRWIRRFHPPWRQSSTPGDTLRRRTMQWWRRFRPKTSPGSWISTGCRLRSAKRCGLNCSTTSTTAASFQCTCAWRVRRCPRSMAPRQTMRGLEYLEAAQASSH